uniref:flagellin n=1 Tax=Yersinia similis TaxID=367190 RepID=UPI0011A83950
NSEKLFAKDGKMRKELNFQSGTDAESSLKLDLNSVIEELTESVTKQGTAIIADQNGTKEQQELFALSGKTTTAKAAKDAADQAVRDLGAGKSVGGNPTATVTIPAYTNAAGKTINTRDIATTDALTQDDLDDIAGAVDVLTKEHTKAAKASTDYAVNYATGNGVMNMKLMDKDLAMMADKKLSEVIDAYGAFRATLGANQNRLQSSSNNLDNMISNTAQALGSIKDTDFADEMKNHAQSEMLMQSSVMMLKKANAATQLISTLLQG